MTGICTDIANTLGQYCRKDSNAELWRLKVLCPILAGYCVGGIFGQAAFLGMKENAMLLPCFFVGSIGLVYLSLPFVKRAEVVLKSNEAIQKEYKQVVEVKRDARIVSYENYRNVDSDTVLFMKDLESQNDKGKGIERVSVRKVSFEDVDVNTLS